MKRKFEEIYKEELTKLFNLIVDSKTEEDKLKYTKEFKELIIEYNQPIRKKLFI